MVNAVQDAINPFWCNKGGASDSNGECSKNLPPLSQVKLALQTVRDTKAAVEADYLIASVQGLKDSSQTQEIDPTLKPHKPPQEQITVTGIDEFAKVRALPYDTIKHARDGMNATYGQGDQMLDTEQIDVQIAFAVTWDWKIGVNKWKILFLSANASLERSSKTTNIITVSFIRPKKT